MPSEGVELSPRSVPVHQALNVAYLSVSGNILTNEEVLRLAALFVKSGVTKIRLTGGEPTVRKGISEIIGTFTIPATAHQAHTIFSWAK
jgi:molybdenum cofactor biosynthesis enzyme MoaA